MIYSPNVIKDNLTIKEVQVIENQGLKNVISRIREFQTNITRAVIGNFGKIQKVSISEIRMIITVHIINGTIESITKDIIDEIEMFFNDKSNHGE